MKGYVYFLAQYAAPYMGNFVASLVCLEKALNHLGYCVIYVFPQMAETKVWMTEFAEEHEVYFTCDEVRSRFCISMLKDLFHKKKPILIHTHFDGYDVAATKASACFNCQIVWHLHNHLSFVSGWLKKIYQTLCFARHYGYYGRKGVFAISVSAETARFVSKFAFPQGRIVVIPNGIDTSRLRGPSLYREGRTASRQITKKVRFLTFGGRNIQKRVDLLLNAASLIAEKVDFEIWITKGTDTEEVVRSLFRQMPQWLTLIDQTEEIASLYGQVDCFISCSDCETFSYAVAEACYSGLPVIQSDIEGTAWNKPNPGCITFESGNEKKLAERMLQFCEQGAISMEKAGSISRFIESRYTLNKWSESIIKFYKLNNLI